MQTSKQVQVRIDARASASKSTGRVSRRMSPCIVTTADGTTTVIDKSKKTAKGV